MHHRAKSERTLAKDYRNAKMCSLLSATEPKFRVVTYIYAKYLVHYTILHEQTWLTGLCKKIGNLKFIPIEYYRG